MGTNNRDRRGKKKRRQLAADRARERRRETASSAPIDLCAVVVAGEPADVLLEALLHFKWRTRADGVVSVSFRLEPELGAPLARALMRIEAELLLADADGVGTEADQERTHDQRLVDALFELVERLVNLRTAA